MFNPSLIELASFAPDNSAVKEYIENTKSKWSSGNYWLGGQIKLDPNDKITEEIINKVQKKYDVEDIYYCNSIEMASIWHSKRQLSEIQKVVEQYRDHKKKILLTDLNKTILNSDVNNLIVSMCE